MDYELQSLQLLVTYSHGGEAIQLQVARIAEIEWLSFATHKRGKWHGQIG